MFFFNLKTIGFNVFFYGFSNNNKIANYQTIHAATV